MVTLNLGKHDFLFAIEGFARGSHLRQHVWENIVFKSIPQMDNDMMDFLWFYMRRDLWECYFDKYDNCGKEDFLHCMAALHRGNRCLVTSRIYGTKKKLYSEAYYFDGHYRPLFYSEGKTGKSKFAGFSSYIADEDIIEIGKMKEMPENRYVEFGKESWWKDIDVYKLTTK